jgi:hypothetical protein
VFLYLFDTNYQNKEQRINIKFCAKFRKIGSETCIMLSEEYDMEAVNKSTVFEWNAQFRVV